MSQILNQQLKDVCAGSGPTVSVAIELVQHLGLTAVAEATAKGMPVVSLNTADVLKAVEDIEKQTDQAPSEPATEPASTGKKGK